MGLRAAVDAATLPLASDLSSTSLARDQPQRPPSTIVRRVHTGEVVGHKDRPSGQLAKPGSLRVDRASKSGNDSDFLPLAGASQALGVILDQE